MNRVLDKLVHLLQLTRAGLGLSAVSNVWLVIFLAAAEVEPMGAGAPVRVLPLWAALLAGAAVAAGLHTYGIALNDVLDARHDRLFVPHRPIPSGRIARTSAVVLAVLCLLLAIGASVTLGAGAVILCVLTAGGVLFYNATGKFFPATGIVSLGLIRLLNMFIANPELGFAWPLWLTMTHVMATAAAAHLIGNKRPRMGPAEAWLLLAGWLFWTLALVGWMSWRDTLMLDDYPLIWLGPTVAAAAFVPTAWLLRRWSPAARRSRRAAGGEFLQLAMLWLIVYDAAWLASTGLYAQAAAHALLLALAATLTGALNTPGWMMGTPTYRVS